MRALNKKPYHRRRPVSWSRAATCLVCGARQLLQKIRGNRRPQGTASGEPGAESAAMPAAPGSAALSSPNCSWETFDKIDEPEDSFDFKFIKKLEPVTLFGILFSHFPTCQDGVRFSKRTSKRERTPCKRSGALFPGRCSKRELDPRDIRPFWQ